MIELTLQPGVYSTGNSKTLINLLEEVWVRDRALASDKGIMYIMSGFANYNGGVRFFETFKKHCAQGGKIVAIFAGSSSSNLTSKQVVESMLACGAEVHVVKRSRLLHAKCYGSASENQQSLVVTSGNFTGPGMSQNIELSVLLDTVAVNSMNFSWQQMLDSVFAQNWAFYKPTLNDPNSPAWQLLYDEKARKADIDDMNKVTMILKLGHADTVRINAAKGTKAATGTQYFWLSKDCYDFFPPLTIRNAKGTKATYSCDVSVAYVDLGAEEKCRVTFEAENNLDFRLGTGPLRYTGLAGVDDIAAISRVGEARYELRIFRQNNPNYTKLLRYAVHQVGSRDKHYGYLPNADFFALL